MCIDKLQILEICIKEKEDSYSTEKRTRSLVYLKTKL